jgi:hypothetical protein
VIVEALELSLQALTGLRDEHQMLVAHARQVGSFRGFDAIRRFGRAVVPICLAPDCGRRQPLVLA